MECRCLQGVPNNTNKNIISQWWINFFLHNTEYLYLVDLKRQGWGHKNVSWSTTIRDHPFLMYSKQDLAKLFKKNVMNKNIKFDSFTLKIFDKKNWIFLHASVLCLIYRPNITQTWIFWFNIFSTDIKYTLIYFCHHVLINSKKYQNFTLTLSECSKSISETWWIEMYAGFGHKIRRGDYEFVGWGWLALTPVLSLSIAIASLSFSLVAGFST